MKAFISQEEYTRNSTSKKGASPRIEGRFLAIPETWIKNLKDDEGKILNTKALQILRNIEYLNNEQTDVDIVTSYDQLINMSIIPCKQDVIKYGLKKLVSSGILSYEVKKKGYYSSEKKLVIKLDIIKLKSLSSGHTKSNSSVEKYRVLLPTHIERENNIKNNISKELDNYVDDYTARAYPSKNTDLSDSIETFSEAKIIKPQLFGELTDLTDEEVQTIFSKSGRSFNATAIRKICSSIKKKYPDKSFLTRSHLISFMTLAVKNEKTPELKLNQEGYFKLTKSQWQEEYREAELEKRLYQNREKERARSYEAKDHNKSYFENSSIQSALSQLLPLETENKNTEMNQEQNALEKSKNLPFELSAEIFKTFGSPRSGEIMDQCKFTQVEPDKLEVKTGENIILSQADKDSLKTCIRSVYGNQINIVATAVTKKTQPETKFLEERQNTYVNQKWNKFRSDLLKYFPESHGDHIVKAWFDKMNVSECEKSGTIILAGSDFMVDSIYQRFQSAIQGTSDKNKVSLELRFESGQSLPIIFNPTKK